MNNDHFIIDVMRHGEPVGGRRFRGNRDDPLSETGWAQAREATRAKAWCHIVSSPLIRCSAFAQALSADTGASLHINDDFREISFGEWEGLTPEELQDRQPDAMARFWADPQDYFPPDGEGIRAFQQRIASAWHTLVATAHPEPTLLVCHGGVVRAILCTVLGIPLGHFWRIDVHYASMTRFAVRRTPNALQCRLLSHAAPVDAVSLARPN